MGDPGAERLDPTSEWDDPTSERFDLDSDAACGKIIASIGREAQREEVVISF
jgi:hypothetical protein